MQEIETSHTYILTIDRASLDAANKDPLRLIALKMMIESLGLSQKDYILRPDGIYASRKVTV